MTKAPGGARPSPSRPRPRSRSRGTRGSSPTPRSGGISAPRRTSPAGDGRKVRFRLPFAGRGGGGAPRRLRPGPAPPRDRPCSAPATLLDDIGLLAGLDHAQLARLALERALLGQRAPALAQLRVLRAQLGAGGALAPRLAVRLHPADRRSDVEVEDEREDADQRPAPEAIPADPGTAIHA